MVNQSDRLISLPLVDELWLLSRSERLVGERIQYSKPTKFAFCDAEAESSAPLNL